MECRAWHVLVFIICIRSITYSTLLRCCGLRTSSWLRARFSHLRLATELQRFAAPAVAPPAVPPALPAPPHSLAPLLAAPEKHATKERMRLTPMWTYAHTLYVSHAYIRKYIYKYVRHLQRVTT